MGNRQIVTLTTDWLNNNCCLLTVGKDDADRHYPLGEHYIALLKWKLHQIAPELEIIDIAHSIKAFDDLQASLILRGIYQYYPEGSIHFVGVNSEPSPANRIALLKKNGHYFVGANNGMFGMVFDGEPDFVCELRPESDLRGFAAPDLLVKAVRRLIDAPDTMDSIGDAVKMNRKQLPQPTYDKVSITGNVMYIDSFGNLISNIGSELFYKVRRNRAFGIIVNSNTITELSTYYDDVDAMESLAMFNSLDLLEIAVCRDSFATLYGCDSKTQIKIEFVNRMFY